MKEKVEKARLEALKSSQVIRHVGLETSAFDCPIRDYSPPKKPTEPPKEPWMLEVDHGRAFSSAYGVHSHNRKRCLSKEEDREIDQLLYHYQQITLSPEKRAVRSLSPENGANQGEFQRSTKLL
jgi:hypothetical protein